MFECVSAAPERGCERFVASRKEARSVLSTPSYAEARLGTNHRLGESGPVTRTMCVSKAPLFVGDKARKFV